MTQLFVLWERGNHLLWIPAFEEETSVAGATALLGRLGCGVATGVARRGLGDEGTPPANPTLDSRLRGNDDGWMRVTVAGDPTALLGEGCGVATGVAW